MKLPIPFLSSKNKDSDYYLALILTEDKASAVILKESGAALKTVNTHEEFFSESIEDLSLESFIDIVDKTISRAEEILPPQIETHKTVFGVKDKWVEKETKKIKKEYLDKLKKVCDALDLQPIGFMVTSEAVTHLIQDEEGAPLSAIMAEIGDKQVSLSLLRGGKVVESISSTLMHSAPHTVDKLLSHFTVPVLPARIVLYLNKPDKEASQAFISHHWSKSLPFLHMPQVTVLPAGFDTRSVMVGAASQMGFTVAADPHEALPKLTTEERKEEEAMAEESLEEEPRETEELSEKEAEEKEDELEHHEPKMDNIAPVPAGQEDFGFVVNGDAKETSHGHDEDDGPHETHHAEHSMHHDAEEQHEKHHESGLSKKLPFLSNLPAISLPKNLKAPNLGGMLGGLKGNKAPLKIIIPVIALLILIIGSSMFYINNVQATIVLTISPKTVNENASVTFSASEPSNFDNNIIQARNVSTAIPTQLSANATGKKDVGDKAKGSVTIYNNSDDPVTISSGAELKANNGEVFVLDKEVKIAAASGDIFTGTKPGTADANVTAKELGTEGNIPSGTRFTIGSASSLAARNDDAFTGGTKKNVTVVSKSDLEKLRSDAEKSVNENAQQKLLSEAKDGETVLPVVGDATLQNVKYDKKEGDEASKVSLTANVVFIGMAYQNTDLEEYAKKVLKNEYADDVRLADDSVKGKVESAELKDGKTVSASLSLEGGLLPDINNQDVIKNVKDKSLGGAKEILANLPQVTSTDITFSPPVLLLPNLFPRLPNQITVDIKTK